MDNRKCIVASYCLVCIISLVFVGRFTVWFIITRLSKVSWVGVERSVCCKKVIILLGFKLAKHYATSNLNTIVTHNIYVATMEPAANCARGPVHHKRCKKACLSLLVRRKHYEGHKASPSTEVWSDSPPACTISLPQQWQLLEVKGVRRYYKLQTSRSGQCTVETSMLIEHGKFSSTIEKLPTQLDCCPGFLSR